MHSSNLYHLSSLSFFNDTATTEIYTLSLHDALPIYLHHRGNRGTQRSVRQEPLCSSVSSLVECEVHRGSRSEEHTSELQSLRHLVCRLLLEKKKKRHDKGSTLVHYPSELRWNIRR